MQLEHIKIWTGNFKHHFHIINKHFKINETWKPQITHTDTSIDLTNNYSSSCWNIYQKQNFHRLNFPALKQDLA